MNFMTKLLMHFVPTHTSVIITYGEEKIECHSEFKFLWGNQHLIKYTEYRDGALTSSCDINDEIFQIKYPPVPKWKIFWNRIIHKKDLGDYDHFWPYLKREIKKKVWL